MKKVDQEYIDAVSNDCVRYLLNKRIKHEPLFIHDGTRNVQYVVTAYPDVIVRMK